MREKDLLQAEHGLCDTVNFYISRAEPEKDALRLETEVGAAVVLVQVEPTGERLAAALIVASVPLFVRRLAPTAPRGRGRRRERRLARLLRRWRDDLDPTVSILLVAAALSVLIRFGAGRAGRPLAERGSGRGRADGLLHSRKVHRMDWDVESGDVERRSSKAERRRPRLQVIVSQIEQGMQQREEHTCWYG